MASPVPTGYRDDGYDLADLRDRVSLFSAQNKMLDNQVRQNSGSIKFNFRTINVILVLCIAGSFWLQQINRIADRQEAALEECEAMLLKIMGDKYQARGLRGKLGRLLSPGRPCHRPGSRGDIQLSHGADYGRSVQIRP